MHTAEWSAYSPDMNPCENLWKLIKADIMDKHPEFTTMKDNQGTKAHLIEYAKEAWNALDGALLDKMYSRCKTASAP